MGDLAALGRLPRESALALADTRAGPVTYALAQQQGAWRGGGRLVKRRRGGRAGVGGGGRGELGRRHRGAAARPAPPSARLTSLRAPRAHFAASGGAQVTRAGAFGAAR